MRQPCVRVLRLPFGHHLIEHFVSVLVACLMSVGASVGAIAEDKPTDNLPYSDDELERFLASLDLDTRVGALLMVQLGMAAAYQSGSVGIEKSEDPGVTSTIGIHLRLRVANANDVSLSQCNEANRWLMKYILGGVWQAFGGNGPSTSEQQPNTANGEDGGFGNYVQLASIEQRMLGFVGTRQDKVGSQRSFEQMSSELKRYIPAYNALKFTTEIFYVDQSGAKISNKQRCASRGK